MTKNFNKWIFEGNLLRDPEMRYTPSGHPVTTLFVACNNAYAIGEGDKVQKVEEIVIYKASAWNSLAGAAKEYLSKGSHILIEAQPVAEQKLEKGRNGRPKIWTDKDGQPHADFECKILELRMLGGAPRSEDQPASSAESSQEGQFPPSGDPELPS